MARSAFDRIIPHQLMTASTRARILRLAAAWVAGAKVEQFWVGDFHHSASAENGPPLRLIALTRVALGQEPPHRMPNPRWPRFSHTQGAGCGHA